MFSLGKILGDSKSAGEFRRIEFVRVKGRGKNPTELTSPAVGKNGQPFADACESVAGSMEGAALEASSAGIHEWFATWAALGWFAAPE